MAGHILPQGFNPKTQVFSPEPLLDELASCPFIQRQGLRIERQIQLDHITAAEMGARALPPER